MKNPLMIFLVILTWATSCIKKIDTIQSPLLEENKVAATSFGAVENLGTPFIISNVSSKINPLNPWALPLITFHPNSNSGNELVMIDNGELNGSTPIHAFRFVAVNLDANSYKIIKIYDPVNGTEVTNSVGRITRYTFGMDKKYYVATEGSDGGGGHIIQYDPNTQTAWDLGKPFNANGSYLDIYSLHVGTDNALYGGSFGGSGQVYTFRYDYHSFDVDKTPIDNTSRYVSYISGDANYTYAACGENEWILYAINRATKQKKVLLTSDVNHAIELNTFTDAPYAHLISTTYKLSDGQMTAVSGYNLPTAELYYSPYTIDAIANTVINWDNNSKKFTYSLNGTSSKDLIINDVLNDTYRTGNGVWMNNQFYLSCANHELVSSLSNTSSQWQLLGNTGSSIYSMCAGNNNNIYIGAYPKGNLFSYNTQLPWNLDGANITSIAPSTLKTSTNPKLLAGVQNADAAGNFGPMYLAATAATKNNYIVYAGDDDRITSSSGRVLSAGYYYNSSYKNLNIADFNNYQFSGMCLNNDSTKMIISAIANNGGMGKIYVCDVATNSITVSFTFPETDPGKIVSYDADNIAGVYADVIYLFNIKTGKIVFKQVLGNGQAIYAITKATDNSVFIDHMYLSAINFRVLKFNFITVQNTFKATQTSVGVFSDVQNNEDTKPDNLTLTRSGNASADLYISGLKSVYRIKAVAMNK